MKKEGKSNTEIGDALGITRQAVGQMLKKYAHINHKRNCKAPSSVTL